MSGWQKASNGAQQQIQMPAKSHMTYAGHSAVADPGERPAPPPYFSTKMRPREPKNIFLETAPPPRPLSQGLNDRPPSLSEGLDPPLQECV